MGKNNDAETRVHTSLLEAGRIRCGSEGSASSLVSRLKHKRAGSLFVCCFQNPKFPPALFLTFSLFFFAFHFIQLLFCTTPTRYIQALHLPQQTKQCWNKFREVLIRINLPFLNSNASKQTSTRSVNSSTERLSVLQRVFLLFSKRKETVAALKARSPAKRRKKRTQNLTKYGQYAEQDGNESMDAHSHPLSAGFTLCPNPPLITPTWLKQVNKWN